MLKIEQPFVLLEQKVVAPHAARILGENRRGAFEATEHLLQKGHTRISFLTGNIAWPAIEERIIGYQEALQTYRAGQHPDLITYCDWTAQAAFEATVELLTAQPDITAILGANDVLAVGALQAIRSSGRAVPDEVAVIGFDDFDFAQYARPRLTTVRLPGYKMGRQAAEALLDYLDTNSFAASELHLPTRLIVRESS